MIKNVTFFSNFAPNVTLLAISVVSVPFNFSYTFPIRGHNRNLVTRSNRNVSLALTSKIISASIQVNWGEIQNNRMSEME